MNAFITQGFILFSAAALLAFLLFPLLIKLAPKFGLIDKPNIRKVHVNPTPLVGGLALIVLLWCATILSEIFLYSLVEHAQMLFATLFIFALATWDDRADLNPRLRLAAQIVAALFVAWSGVRIESLSGLFGVHELPVFVQYLLTVVVLTGVVNAFNLMDGVNGLVGGLALINTLVLAGLTWFVGMPELTLLLFTLSGGLAVFLKFNSNPAKLFMGDSGSMMLGFLLSVIGIKVLQMAHFEHEPESTLLLVILSLFLIPVIDALRVFAFRFTVGKSVLQPDKSHLHHLILITGSTHWQISIFIIILQVILILSLPIIASIFNDTIAVFASIATLVFLAKILSFNKTMIEWQTNVRKNEIIND